MGSPQKLPPIVPPENSGQGPFASGTAHPADPGPVTFSLEASGAASTPTLRDSHPYHVGFQVSSPKTRFAPQTEPAAKTPASALLVSPPSFSPDHGVPSPIGGQLTPKDLEGVRFEGRPRPGTAESRHFSRFSSANRLAASMTRAGGPNLHIRLLKERMELEVAMKREGLRLFVFGLFLMCLCIALSISSMTIVRNDSQHLVTTTLGLDDIEDVSTPGDVYSFITAVAENSRSFFPLSSLYIEDPLSAVLLNARTTFPSGPLQVPADAQPQLRLTWSMTTWYALEDVNSLRKDVSVKYPIIRKYLADDSSSLACWAWSAMGPGKFMLEYGRHNMDEGYVELILDFLEDQADLDGELLAELVDGGMQLASIIVNGTHAIGYLQAGEAILNTTVPLENGMPTDCPGSNMEVGGRNTVLADLKFHPRTITQQQFQEIIEGAQILEDIATGAAPNQPPVLEEPQDSSADLAATQALAYDQKLLTKVVGDLVDSGLVSLMDKIDEIERPRPDSSSTEELVAPGSGTDFVAIEGLRPVDLVNATDKGRPFTVSELDLTDAFAGVMGDEPGNFTLTWWAKSQNSIKGLQELVFFTPEGQPRFQVYWQQNSVFEGVPGWTFQFYSSPFCFDASALALGTSYRSKCREAPSWWCQAPSANRFGGTYDDIWRHFSLRYQNVDEGSIEFFLDGHPLCGVTISGSVDLAPQGSPSSPSTVAFGVLSEEDAGSLTEQSSLQVKDMRLYERALGDQQIKSLGLDPNVSECLDLETNRDDPLFRTDFGLSCFQLAQAVAGSEPLAPVACKTDPGVLSKCPVSCLASGEQSICWDELPPMISGELPVPMPPSTATYTTPSVLVFPDDSRLKSLRWGGSGHPQLFASAYKG